MELMDIEKQLVVALGLFALAIMPGHSSGEGTWKYLGNFRTPGTTQTRIRDGRPKRIYPSAQLVPSSTNELGKIGGSPVPRPGASQASAPPGEALPTPLWPPPPPPPWTIPRARAGPCRWGGRSQGLVPVPTDGSCGRRP